MSTCLWLYYRGTQRLLLISENEKFLGYFDPILLQTLSWNVNKDFYDCFPLKKATRKQRRFKKPWLTKSLLKFLKYIKRKNNLYKQYLQVPTTDNGSLYKHAKTNWIIPCLWLTVEIMKSNWKMLNQMPMPLEKILSEVLKRKNSSSQLNTAV